MHKIRLCIFISLFALLLTSCGVPLDVKQTANKYKNENTKRFEEIVAQELGSDVTVSNIEGHIDSQHIGVWFDHTYKALPQLDGVITYKGIDYDASYNIETDSVVSTISLETIRESLLDYLPLSKDSVVYCQFYKADYTIPQFSLNVWTFEDALKGSVGRPNYNLSLKILTTDDISDLTEEDFQDYIDMCYRYNTSVNLQIFSANTFDTLKNDSVLSELMATEYGTRPRVYDNKAQDYVDIFDLYGLNNTIYISIETGDVRFYLTE